MITHLRSHFISYFLEDNCLIFFHIFDREADSSHLVFAKADNLNFITKCENILNTIDSFFTDLGNVYHSLFTRCKLNECSEFFDADNLSFKKLSCFVICNDCLDVLEVLAKHAIINAGAKLKK